MSFLNKRKKSNRKLRSLGTSLVEYGLLVTLIAVIAIQAVKDLGWKTTCKNAMAAALISTTTSVSGTTRRLDYKIGKCGFYNQSINPSYDLFAPVISQFQGICSQPASANPYYSSCIIN